jgi:hypothetical protein
VIAWRWASVGPVDRGSDSGSSVADTSVG